MQKLGYYNGKYGELEEMTVPMNDRVCFFGDGVYDATYSRNYKIFALDEHLDRFFNSAALLKMEVPHTKKELGDILQEMVSKMDTGENFVYWQLTRGTGVRNHVFPECKANVWITLVPKDIVDTYAKIKLTTMEDTRFFHCNIKTLNLIPSVMASQKTLEAGCDEAIFHRGDLVTECAHSNVSILKDGKFITHQLDNLVLPGITRMNLIKLCNKLGIPVEERDYTLDELMDADEIIVSSSGSLCMQAVEVDGKPVGGKAPELLNKIQDAYIEKIKNETSK